MKRIIPFLFVMLLAGCSFLNPYYKPSEEVQARKDVFFKANPSLLQEVKKNIQEGNIVVGMTKEQVVAAWGDPWPDRGSKSIFANGTNEFCYYSAEYPYEYMLHFVNGKLYSMTKDRAIY